MNTDWAKNTGNLIIPIFQMDLLYRLTVIFQTKGKCFFFDQSMDARLLLDERLREYPIGMGVTINQYANLVNGRSEDNVFMLYQMEFQSLKVLKTMAKDWGFYNCKNDFSHFVWIFKTKQITRKI